MRKLLLLIMTGFILLACNNNKKPEKENTPAGDSTKSNSTQVVNPVNPLEKLLGSFVGAFGDNKITLLIIKAEGDSILGRSIVGGNDRPFAGIFVKNDKTYSITAKEPGDHKDDGVFSFNINEDSVDMVTGSWKPNDTKRPAKEYSLQRKKFEYKPDAGNWPEASQRLLKADDIENLPKRVAIHAQ